MSPATLAFCLCLSFGGGAPAQDRWVAEDKLRHFFASFVATTLTASAARTAGADLDTSAWIGAGVGAGVGAWKELRDLGTPGETPSLRDLAWDLAGVGAGYAVVRQTR